MSTEAVVVPTVLFVHPSAELYGSDRQLVESVRAFEADGWNAVVAISSSGPLIKQLGNTPVLTAPFPVLRKSLLRPLGLLGAVMRSARDIHRMVGTLRSIRPDLVYVNTLTIPWWIVAAKIVSCPILVHVHEAEDGFPRFVSAALSAPLLLARTVVSNSAASRDVLIAAMPRLAGRTVVVRNGVPDQGPSEASAAYDGHIVLVGRLSPRKGTDVALEAIAQLRRGGRDLRITLCGSAFAGYEWFEEELRRRTGEPDLANAVTFAGFIDSTADVLASASIVLVPSRVEPFGNTAVEAQLAGRPLIAADTQGLREIVEHDRNGLLVPPGDSGALADAIATLLDDPARAARLAGQGRADAVQAFSITGYRARLLSAACEAAQTNRPHVLSSRSLR